MDGSPINANGKENDSIPISKLMKETSLGIVIIPMKPCKHFNSCMYVHVKH